MYRALIRFRDLTDGHLYEAGEAFPHDGRDVPPERIDVLLSGKNAASQPLIVKVEEEVKQIPQARKTARKTTKK